MRFRLVATDLDGTVLPTAQTDDVAPAFTQRMHDAIARVRAAGVPVIAVTARSPRTAAPLAARLGMSSTAICGSGSIVYDLEAGAISALSALDAAVASHLVQHLRTRMPGVWFAAEQGIEHAREPGYPRSPFTPPASVEEDALAFLERAPTTKLICRNDDVPVEDLHDEVRGAVGARASTEWTGTGWVGVLHPDATKASALARLCAALGIRPEEVLAFGDHEPDAAMLRWAGLGVAVANGTPAARAAADRVAPSSDEDGVASVLDELLDAGAF